MSYTPEERRARRRAIERRYVETHKEERRERQRRWYSEHREEINTKRRENIARRKRVNLNQRINILTRQEQESQRRKPKQCDVCGNDKHRIEFDHCHQRGIFRGWLCGPRNRALGNVRDNSDTLRKLIAYLERTKTTIPPQLSLPGV